MEYTYNYDVTAGNLSSSPWLAWMAMIMSTVGIIVGIVLWVYTSYAFMVIGKKAGYSMPALAWIPAVGPLIIASQVAKMHWWPILILILMWVPIINFIAGAVLLVYFVIWMWKVAEARHNPGWWGLLASLGNIIPVIGTIIALVFLGMIAWIDKGSKEA